MGDSMIWKVGGTGNWEISGFFCFSNNHWQTQVEKRKRDEIEIVQESERYKAEGEGVKTKLDAKKSLTWELHLKHEEHHDGWERWWEIGPCTHAFAATD